MEEVLKYYAKTKQEFMTHITNFEEPYLNEGDEQNQFDTLNRWFMICDRKKFSRSITLPGCKMSHKLTMSSKFCQKDLDDYEIRENALRAKYTRWLNEAKETKILQ